MLVGPNKRIENQKQKLGQVLYALMKGIVKESELLSQ
jgi:hypothetical protein